MPENEAMLYEAPFAYVLRHVKPEREQNNREAYRRHWWKHGEPRIAMRAALAGLPRYIATPETAKHRFFVWMEPVILPDKTLIVIARSDDTTFGILHSRFNEVWTMTLGAPYGSHPTARRYNPSKTFEMFPFPEGVLSPKPAADRFHGPRGNAGCAAPRHESLERCAVHSHAGAWERSKQVPSPDGGGLGWGRVKSVASLPFDRPPPNLPPSGGGTNSTALTLPSDSDSRFPAIAEAASRLNELRENWLNPPEWVERVPEVVPGYPDRILPKQGHETELKQRTLTNLSNQRPSWLDNAHKTLDKAVAEAYGWTDYTPAMPDEEILRRLLALNLLKQE